MGHLLRDHYDDIGALRDSRPISLSDRRGARADRPGPRAVLARCGSQRPQHARSECGRRSTSLVPYQPFRVLTIATQRPTRRHSSLISAGELRQCFVSAGSRRHSSVLEYTPRPRESPERRSPSDLPFGAPLLPHTLTRRQSDGLRRRRPRVDSRRLRA